LNNGIYSLNVVGYRNNKSIAIVDDEVDNVTLFTKVMQENGYHVMGFTNPLFFIDYIREHPDKFSLIILDYRMSPMQGCEISNKISTINPKIKMILLTAYDEIKNNSLNLEIVKKPITNTKLLQIIQQYLN
ncbi:MAG TPA: response regulator, partial [Nitrososphaeraceae archaeon]|nr:response regulator [Nitrososphaeraceae archaeon]